MMMGLNPQDLQLCIECIEHSIQDAKGGMDYWRDVHPSVYQAMHERCFRMERLLDRLKMYAEEYA